MNVLSNYWHYIAMGVVFVGGWVVYFVSTRKGD